MSIYCFKTNFRNSSLGSSCQMKSIFNLLSKCPQISLVHQEVIFICGAVKVLKLQIFAEFFVGVAHPYKKFFASNLGRLFPK